MANLSPLLVWCDLAGPLCGDPPMLEGLLVGRAVILNGTWQRFTRADDCPPCSSLPEIYVGWSDLAGHRVYHCSSPIMSPPGFDITERYSQRFPVTFARDLIPSERIQINTTGGEFKSYRLPNRVRGIARVCWIVEGNWREIRKLLRDVWAVGKDRGQGYGAVKADDGDGTRVAAWGCVERPDLGGCWWYAPDGDRLALMRQLPFGDWLPEGLTYARRGFGSVSPPMWHPDRFTEVIEPC